MKIFRPTLAEKGGAISVSARIETKTCPIALPEAMWFSFPKRYSEYVSGDINGFAAALLPLAMILGEDLHIEGAISPRLLRGMEEYQHLQSLWEPSPFKPIRIAPEKLEPTSRNTSIKGVGSSYSGGIDSAHTLWRHLPENEPNPHYRISHCLMINGFGSDSDHDRPGDFSRIEQALQPMMSRIGVQLIVCETNYMAFSEPIIFKQSFGAMLVSPALVLGGLYSAFHIPSSYRFDEFFRDGSHPILDHLIATETMETIHDSPHVKRTKKTEKISRWSETYSTLRVCGRDIGYDKETNSIQNCCRCEKCIRTMMTLKMYGRLESYTTFSKKLRHRDVWLCRYGYIGSRIFAKEIISEALRTRRFGILMDFCVSLLISGITLVPRTILRNIHLSLEGRSDTYARQIRRLFPHLRDRPRIIR